jgi:hypothetical protein
LSYRLSRANEHETNRYRRETRCSTEPFSIF